MMEGERDFKICPICATELTGRCLICPKGCIKWSKEQELLIKKYEKNAPLVQKEEKEVGLPFHCGYCKKDFRSVGYDNPVFLADKVADCPLCEKKSWMDYEAAYKELKRSLEG
jgi:uncharacterized Zn-finger protein